MSASFRGHSFKEGGNGATSFPVWERKGKLAILEIPGADADVIQRFGKKSPTLALLVTCTKSELQTLDGDICESGSLVYHFGTRTAVLESISGPHEILTGDLYVVTLNFIGL